QAGVFRLAAVAPGPRGGPVLVLARLPLDARPARQQLAAGLVEPPVAHDIMRHPLPDALSARRAGLARHQPQLLHPLGPFLIVVAAPAGIAEIQAAGPMPLILVAAVP